MHACTCLLARVASCAIPYELWGSVQTSEDGDHLNWVFKNKDHGKAAAVASLGLITLWDVQGGLFT